MAQLGLFLLGAGPGASATESPDTLRHRLAEPVTEPLVLQAADFAGGRVEFDAARPVEIHRPVQTVGDLTLVSPGGFLLGPAGSLHGERITVLAPSAPRLEIAGPIRAREVTLEAAHGHARVSGPIDVSSADDAGGVIRLLGRTVEVSAAAQLSADGASGGGTILIGGDFKGANPAIANAARTGIAAGAQISANATHTGPGGRVIVWSDELTRFHGAIAARGGAQSGDGGFVEVSGKGHLAFRGSVDLLAPAGRTGALLLDPDDIIIAAASPDLNGDEVQGDDVVGNIAATAYPGLVSVITAGQVSNLLSSANLSLAATNSITVNSAISWSSARTLTLTTTAANSSIAINTAINNSGAGGITLNSAGSIYLESNVTTAGIATLDAGGQILNSAGTLSAANLYLRGGGNVGSAAAPLATNTHFLILAKPTGDVFLRDQDVIYLQGRTGGNLSVENLTGAIRGGDAPLLVGGKASFTASTGATDFVSFSQSGNSFADTVSVRAGGYVWLIAAGNLSVGRVTAGSSIDLTFRGTLNLVGAALSGTSIDFDGQGPSDRIVGPLYTATQFSIETYATTNLVADAGFEASSPAAADSLASAGAWFGDANESVTAQNGVTPAAGSGMLKFVRTAADGATNSRSSDTVQIIDLAGSGTLLQNGTGNLLAAAKFNRVAGTASTDRQFRLTLRAYSGAISGHTAAAVPLAETTATLTSDADPATWETLTAALILPANATYASFTVSAFEDVTDDAPPAAEFAGHYADDLRAGLGRAQSQTLAVSSPADLPQSASALTLTASSSVALPVTFSVVSGPASVAGRTLEFTGTGTVVLRATQAGTGLVIPAVVERTFTVVPATQVLYATKFANFPGGEFVGSDGWTGTHLSGAATGVFTPPDTGVPTGFLGFESVPDATVTVRRPVSFNPATAGVPQANFSAEFSVVPSTTFRRDSFAFRVVNLAGETLARVVFDARDSRIYVTNPDGTLNSTSAGTFTYDTPYALRLALNLGSNRWSVWLDGTPIWFNQPITSLGRALTLREVALDWNVTTAGSPGTGYLALTGYSLWSDKGFQVISFTPPADLFNLTSTPILLNATSTSGLPVTLSVFSGPATISGNNLTLTGTGTVVVRASQAGNATTQAATPVDRTITVVPAGFQTGAAATTRPLYVSELGNWTASTGAPWITLPVAAGTAQRLLDVTFAANDTGSDRSATLTIGGTSYNIVQRAAGSGLRELWVAGLDSYGELGLGLAPAPRVFPTLVATGMQAAAAGRAFSLFLGEDGTLWGSGDNSAGQLGLGDSSPRHTLHPIARRVTQVAATTNGLTTLFRTDDGTLWGMGLVNFLTAGATTFTSHPLVIATGVSRVALGSGFAAIVKTDGTLWTTGSNSFGQLGDGTTTARSTFASIATDVAEVACGSNHLVFRKTDRTVWTVGSNFDGEQGNGTTTHRSIAGQIATGAAVITAGSNHTAFVKTDGTLWAHGANYSGQLGLGDTTRRTSPVQIGTGFAAVFGGDGNTFAIKSGATPALWVAGENSYGGLGDGGSGATADRLTLFAHPTIVAARHVTHALGRTLFTLPDGRVLGSGYGGSLSDTFGGDIAVGRLNDGTADQRPLLTLAADGIAAVASRDAGGGGGRVTFFLRNDGSLTGIGRTSWGQFGDGAQSSVRLSPYAIATGVRSISSGGYHTLFVKGDNTLWGMGWNSAGPLGTGNTTHLFTPTQLATGVASAAAGLNHTAFVKTDGTLWTVGANSGGELGDGTTNSTRLSPVQISTGVASVATRTRHTLFVKTDGTLWGFGDNSSYQLGDNTTTVRRSPIQIATGVVAAWTGSTHSIFLKTDGTLWGMGSNNGGLLGLGAATESRVPAQIATDVAGAAAGENHTLFVKTDGTVWAMGRNYYGQLGDGTVTERTTPVQVAQNAAAVFVGTMNSYILGTDQVALTTRPTVLTPPADITVAAGGDASLSLLASGNAAPTYQWFKDGLPLVGATASTLALDDVTSAAAGTYTVRVSNASGGFFSAPATVTIATGFDAWRLANFSSGDLNNPAVSGPAATGPDGVSNLLRYALGLAAGEDATPHLPEAGQAGGFWTYTYGRPADRLDLTYSVEVSTNLVQWTTSGVTLHELGFDGTRDYWQARYPAAGTPTLFFRLRVIR